MTREQSSFVNSLRQTYFVLFGPDPFEKSFAEASVREDDVETARLAGLLIIAMEVDGALTERAAMRWIELFEPMCADLTVRPAS